MFAVKMPREVGPEKRHFGGEDGLITETTGGPTRHFWRCVFCNWEMGGENFQNNKARIHLSGDHNLRNGLVSIVTHHSSNTEHLELSSSNYFSSAEQTKMMNF